MNELVAESVVVDLEKTAEDRSRRDPGPLTIEGGNRMQRFLENSNGPPLLTKKKKKKKTEWCPNMWLSEVAA